jgi:hypothetical protein
VCDTPQPEGAPSAQVSELQAAAGRRAAAVREALVGLWGEQLPPGDRADAVALLLADAVLVDDEAGAVEGLVVQSDGLTVDVLARLLGGAAGPGLALLPEALRRRVQAAYPDDAGAGRVGPSAPGPSGPF